MTVTNITNATLAVSDDQRAIQQYIEYLGIQTSDRVVASMFMIGLLVGLLGNISAVSYFWPRRKKTIHDLQYLTITLVDSLIVLSSIPIIVSLLNYRNPMLFKSNFFCTAYVTITLFTARMSMFLAMMIYVLLEPFPSNFLTVSSNDIG